MKMQIGRWGNSLAVRIPKEMAERFRLEEGGEISSDFLEEALANERDRRREEAIERIRARSYAMPPGYKFDREEAHERGGEI